MQEDEMTFKVFIPSSQPFSFHPVIQRTLRTPSSIHCPWIPQLDNNFTAPTYAPRKM